MSQSYKVGSLYVASQSAALVSPQNLLETHFLRFTSTLLNQTSGTGQSVLLQAFQGILMHTTWGTSLYDQHVRLTFK